MIRTCVSRTAALLAFIALAIVAGPVEAQNDVRYGLKAGLVGPGCVYVDDSACIDGEVNPGFGGFVDYMLADRLSGGLYLDIQRVGVEAFDETETMFDVGLALKAVIPLSGSNLTFRPGFGFGYGRVVVFDEATTFLTMRVPLEVTVDLASGRSMGGEFGVYFAPMGGTDDADVSFGPGFLLKFVFGF